LQAFRVSSAEDLAAVETSDADLVLLDSGGGSGETFDWTLIRHIRRPYFLAGGLTPANVGDALAQLHPYGVDASSSLETDGWKDPEKMAAFVQAVRNENQKG
jgi:phosphoribosylanthranilate isomerase